MNPVVWAVIGMMLTLAFGASALGTSPDETTPSGCMAAPLPTSAKHIESRTGVRFMVKNHGQPMAIIVCVFDTKGTKVAHAQTILSNLETFSPRFSLIPSRYIAVTEASPAGGEGSVKTSHRADLETCAMGSWVAPSMTTRSGSGFGIVAAHGYCLPVDGVFPWFGGVLDGPSTDTLKSLRTALR